MAWIRVALLLGLELNIRQNSRVPILIKRIPQNNISEASNHSEANYMDSARAPLKCYFPGTGSEQPNHSFAKLNVNCSKIKLLADSHNSHISQKKLRCTRTCLQ